MGKKISELPPITSGPIGSVTPFDLIAIVQPAVDGVTYSAEFGQVQAIFLTLLEVILNREIVYFSVTVDAAALAVGGEVILHPAATPTSQYAFYELHTSLGGTGFFGGGGDRLGQITDGTTVFSLIPAANMQTIDTINTRWGDVALPFPVVGIDTLTAAGADIVFSYSGGASDYNSGDSVVSGFLREVT